MIINIICGQNCVGWCNRLKKNLKSHERSLKGKECGDCMDVPYEMISYGSHTHDTTQNAE